MKNTVSIKQNCVFRAVYRHGKRSVCRTVAVYVMKDRQKTVNRLGITVSVKLGGAVVRNRIRRRLREAYRLSEDSIGRGYDIVLAARSGAGKAPFQNILGDLDRAFTELGIKT